MHNHKVLTYSDTYINLNLFSLLTLSLKQVIISLGFYGSNHIELRDLDQYVLYFHDIQSPISPSAYIITLEMVEIFFRDLSLDLNHSSMVRGILYF